MSEDNNDNINQNLRHRLTPQAIAEINKTVNMKRQIKELVKATLIIGAKRGREDFPTTEDVEPLIEQHVDSFTERFSKLLSIPPTPSHDEKGVDLEKDIDIVFGKLTHIFESYFHKQYQLTTGEAKEKVLELLKQFSQQQHPQPKTSCDEFIDLIRRLKGQATNILLYNSQGKDFKNSVDKLDALFIESNELIQKYRTTNDSDSERGVKG